MLGWEVGGGARSGSPWCPTPAMLGCGGWGCPLPCPVPAHRHLQELLGVLCRALGDASPAVRGAALFALGQFSENLQVGVA